MPALYTPITLQDMHDYLTPQGFQSVQIPYCKEVVYSKLVAKDVCVRVFTSIVYTPLTIGFTAQYTSRPVGGDAIRVCLVKRDKDGYIKGIGSTKRVHRVKGWKKNLQKRIDEMTDRCEYGAYGITPKSNGDLPMQTVEVAVGQWPHQY